MDVGDFFVFFLVPVAPCGYRYYLYAVHSNREMRNTISFGLIIVVPRIRTPRTLGPER
jgi:hypothetical protein